MNTISSISVCLYMLVCSYLLVFHTKYAAERGTSHAHSVIMHYSQPEVHIEAVSMARNKSLTFSKKWTKMLPAMGNLCMYACCWLWDVVFYLKLLLHLFAFKSEKESC